MDQLKPAYFFELKSFKHAALFEGVEFVWEALTRMSSYFNGKGKIEGEISDQAYLIDSEKIWIGKGTVVEPGAYIKGPCILGEGCTVRHGAYIRGNFIAGDSCVIGHDTEVKNALFFDNAHAAHFAYVGDTILGNRVNLGAGTVCANLKLDRTSVEVLVDGGRINTGLRKFGAILGDDVQTGCNSVTNPGTLMGPGARCYPCTNFGGFVPANQAVRSGTKPQKIVVR